MCLDCSGFHRNLGVHISQVRSVELDGCWTDELVEFFASVGNRAFNLVWEANVCETGVIRPQEYPTKGFIRQQFILRKYQQKMFMKYDLGTPPPTLEPLSPTTHFTYQSLSEVQSSSMPSEPISHAEILKAGLLEKLGGQENAVFRSWQSRYLIITHDRRVFYSKTMDSAPVGSIPLDLPPSFEVTHSPPPLFTQLRTKARAMAISTSSSRPLLRVSIKGGGSLTVFLCVSALSLCRFRFRCDSETARLEFIEALRKVMKIRALEDEQVEEEHFGSVVTTPLEDTIVSLTRGFYRWYLDAASPVQMALPPPLPSATETTDLDRSMSPLPSPTLPSSAPLYPPLTIVKEGVLLYRSNRSSSWFPRYCVLTNEAFYISSYTSPPTRLDGSNQTTSSGIARRGSVTQQPPVIVVPLLVVRVDERLPNYSAEPNGPEDAFAVWCPLSYGLLGAQAPIKAEWIAAVAVRHP
jgi:hypothetical protein